MPSTLAVVRSLAGFLTLCGSSLAIPQGNRQVGAAQTANALATTWQNGPGANWPIKTGLVSFGDSYAAGIGTGTTSGDKCRVGENNYPVLLNKWTDRKIDFQNLVCSGDTTSGVGKQVDNWVSPILADIATLSVGGNDVHFGELVKSCITNGPLRAGYGWRKDCAAAIGDAYNRINARGPDTLHDKMTGLYKKILDKSGRTDFRIFHTGYVEFFDETTADCDKSTFTWNWEAYDPSASDSRYIMLVKQHRQNLNNLVLALNGLIQGAINDFNSGYGRDAVKFVNPNPAFKEYPGHQFCATEDVHEPNPGRPETWFFARGWKDHAIDAAANRAPNQELIDFHENNQYANERSLLLQAGKITLPDANTCQDELVEDEDPYKIWACWTAIGVAENSYGIGDAFVRANAALAQKDADSKDIDWFAPTTWVKMFHPRSDGQITYRNQLIADIQHAYDLD